MEAGDKRPVPDPTELSTEALKREISHLRELIESKIEAERAVGAQQFYAISLQLGAIERQRLEQKADTDRAVSAALAAQKEAITKTEADTARQLDQLAATSSTGRDELRRELSDMKERVGRIENVRSGGQQAYAGLIAAVGAFLGIAALGVSIAIAVN